MAETKGRIVVRSAGPSRGGRRNHAETTARHSSGYSACRRLSAHARSSGSSGIAPETGATPDASRADARSLAVKASPEPKDGPVAPDASFSNRGTTSSAAANPQAESETNALSSACLGQRDELSAPIDDAPESSSKEGIPGSPPKWSVHYLRRWAAGPGARSTTIGHEHTARPRCT